MTPTTPFSHATQTPETSDRPVAPNADPSRRIAVFLSGSGRTLDNLLDAIDRRVLHAAIPLVVASRPCLGADKARARGIETLVHQAQFHAHELQHLLETQRIGWCVLAGYLRKLPIPPALRGRVVNIHPALLPRHGGPGMFGDRVHQTVLNARDPVSGCTVHVCDEHYDTGPIVAQARCPVLPGDTVRTLADRVFALETALYPVAIEHLLSARPIPFVFEHDA